MWAYVSPVFALLNFGLSLISSCIIQSARFECSTTTRDTTHCRILCLTVFKLTSTCCWAPPLIHVHPLNVTQRDEFWSSLNVKCYASPINMFAKWIVDTPDCASARCPHLWVGVLYVPSAHWSRSLIRVKFLCNSWGKVSMPAGGIEPTINNTWLQYCTIHVGALIMNPLWFCRKIRSISNQ